MHVLCSCYELFYGKIDCNRNSICLLSFLAPTERDVVVQFFYLHVGTEYESAEEPTNLDHIELVVVKIEYSIGMIGTLQSVNEKCVVCLEFPSVHAVRQCGHLYSM